MYTIDMIESAPQPTSEPAPQVFTPVQPTQTAQSVSSNNNSDPYLVAPENRPQPEQVLLEWVAPNRPFKKRQQKYYVTIGMILMLIALILFFAGQLILIAVGIAAVFLLYVLSSVAPENIKNQITTYGIRSDGQIFYWDEMGRFWYKVRHHQEVLHVEVNRFPNHLTLLLGEVPEEKMTELLSQVLLHEEPLPTAFDKAAMWIQEKIQLDPEA